MTIHSFVKFIFLVVLFLYVTLHHNCVNWQVIKRYFRWRHLRASLRCVKPKPQNGLYDLVSWGVLYFPRPNKRYIYATPLRRIYFLWLHYKLQQFSVSNSKTLPISLFINGFFAACYPNGTIEVTHPASYSHCFAVQDQGLSSAVKCSVSTSGSVSIITGCSQVRWKKKNRASTYKYNDLFLYGWNNSYFGNRFMSIR